MRGRNTGLKHFSEATAPDDWEKSALMAFKSGNMSFLQPVVFDIKHTVRSIRWLVQELQLSDHDQRGLTAIRLKAAEQGLILTITAQAGRVSPGRPGAGGGPCELLDMPKLKRRVESSGGQLEWDALPDGGRTLKASWPLG